MLHDLHIAVHPTSITTGKISRSVPRKHEAYDPRPSDARTRNRFSIPSGHRSKGWLCRVANPLTVHTQKSRILPNRNPPLHISDSIPRSPAEKKRGKLLAATQAESHHAFHSWLFIPDGTSLTFPRALFLFRAQKK